MPLENRAQRFGAESLLEMPIPNGPEDSYPNSDQWGQKHSDVPS
jgi:hypothetical protein